MMPVTYSIDVNRRIIRTKCTGPVTLLEVIDHFRILEQDPERPDWLNVFLDLSDADSIPETWQLASVVDELKRVRGRVRFGACAILARRDALFGMMRMFEVMGEEFFGVTHTFRVPAEAEAWLSSQSRVNPTPDRERNEGMRVARSLPEQKESRRSSVLGKSIPH